jgi:hypothetical protein
MLLAATSANAALFDRGNGMIYDSDRDLTWLSDMNAGGLFNNWSDAKSWADGLTHGGFTDWRLPSVYNSDGSTICMGFGCTDSELGNMYYNVFGAAAGGNINVASNTANRNLFSYPEGTNVFALNEEFNAGTAGSLDPFTCVLTPGLETCAFVFRTDGLQSYGSKGAGNIFYGWAVRNGDVNPVNPGVPEPASWAMMVIGFGLIGAIRRRRSAPVAA